MVSLAAMGLDTHGAGYRGGRLMAPRSRRVRAGPSSSFPPSRSSRAPPASPPHQLTAGRLSGPPEPNPPIQQKGY